MRLLLDECISAKTLIKKLVERGHDVARSIDEVGDGVDDPAVFACALQQDRSLVTYNNVDFIAIVQRGDADGHPGIILVYQDNANTDMTYDQIVNAISNVESIYPQGISNKLIVLNHYRW